MEHHSPRKVSLYLTYLRDPSQHSLILTAQFANTESFRRAEENPCAVAAVPSKLTRHEPDLHNLPASVPSQGHSTPRILPQVPQAASSDRPRLRFRNLGMGIVKESGWRAFGRLVARGCGSWPIFEGSSPGLRGGRKQKVGMSAGQAGGGGQKLTGVVGDRAGQAEPEELPEGNGLANGVVPRRRWRRR